jgi:hypothetical protein
MTAKLQQRITRCDYDNAQCIGGWWAFGLGALYSGGEFEIQIGRVARARGASSSLCSRQISVCVHSACAPLQPLSARAHTQVGADLIFCAADCGAR